ncbi:MAG TPA: PspA/IM30 family protein [Steroidobacteraceae bacterium]|nr:PspA/IM30 family protein [Steroidobacteraceae bacterium]
MATLFTRIQRLVTANAHHAVDQAENPQVMAGQVLRDLGDEVQITRRSLVAALGAERQLVKQREQMQREASDWERKAERPLAAGDEKLARSVLERAVSLRSAAAALETPLATTQRTSQRLREQMQRLRGEWDNTRNRVAVITASQAAAEALGGVGVAADSYSRAMDRVQSLDELSRKAGTMEAHADATAELLNEQESLERAVSAHEQAAAVDAALEALKQRLEAQTPCPTTETRS